MHLPHEPQHPWSTHGNFILPLHVVPCLTLYFTYDLI